MEAFDQIRQAVRDMPLYDLKKKLQESEIFDLKRKLKSMSLTEQYPDLAEAIKRAADAQESLAYHQPPKPMTLGPLHKQKGNNYHES